MERTRLFMKDVVEQVTAYMVHGAHQSRYRELVGVVTIGHGGGDFSFSWKGWIEVQDERLEVTRFRRGISFDEAIRDRSIRDVEVAKRGYRAQWQGGGFGWARKES